MIDSTACTTMACRRPCEKRGCTSARARKKVSVGGHGVGDACAPLMMVPFSVTSMETAMPMENDGRAHVSHYQRDGIGGRTRRRGNHTGGQTYCTPAFTSTYKMPTVAPAIREMCVRDGLISPATMFRSFIRHTPTERRPARP